MRKISKSFTLDPELYQKLLDISIVEKVTPSAFVRTAIEEAVFIRQQIKPEVENGIE
jgi:predicted transcriptional regulator